MKIKLLFLSLVLSISMLTNAKSTIFHPSNDSILKSKDHVEVMTFHAKKRCITCLKIEELTKEVINESFAKELKSGKLVFRNIDITQNKEVAKKYKVAWSSLIISLKKDNKENFENLTTFAFAYARTNSIKFKSELKAKIILALKELDKKK